MSYLTQLQQHNTDLQGLIDKAEALPDASDPVLQDKTVTPTTSTQTITADDNYDGLGTVTVNAMPTATQATPSITVSSAGLITASSTQTAGYVSAGTKSATKQLTTQAAKTITPSTSSQTAVAKNVYTTGAVTVAAIPSNYEDVGTETSTYTTKLASLETAVTALETELAGKASGGSGGANVETCTVTVYNYASFDGEVCYQSSPGTYLVQPLSRGDSVSLTAIQGSFVYVYGTYATQSQTDGARCIVESLFLLTVGSGETATIYLAIGGTDPA